MTEEAASASVPKESASARRRAARLMAVQAVYQILSAGHAPEAVAEEYLAHRTGMDVDGEQMVRPDNNLFKILTIGAAHKQNELQALIEANLTRKDGSPPPVPEPLLRAILLCGAFELAYEQSTDFPIILSDYVTVAKAFYEGREPGLVNAVLDSVRKSVRPA